MQVPAAMCEYENGIVAFKRICAHEGWKTLYKGVGASVARDMLGSSVNLTVQSIASEALVRSMILSPGSPVLGAVSGVLSAAAFGRGDATDRYIARVCVFETTHT